MNVISGGYPHGSYSGKIILRAQPVAFTGIRAGESAGIAIIHQELFLIPDLSITENIFLGDKIARTGIINWGLAKARTRELMPRVGDPETPIKNIGAGKQ
jgi:putative multiple sugar transport system ATP-binding protein